MIPGRVSLLLGWTSTFSHQLLSPFSRISYVHYVQKPSVAPSLGKLRISTSKDLRCWRCCMPKSIQPTPGISTKHLPRELGRC
ncbi:hypothetical protein F4778DRAFT_274591 [Xylariomycetidae sp. FL2044]|nr:hypothetical protein F4778DRAFT_274591 [Xylariomycetidae sp. FL2044]